jgi:hypothetical protein
MVWYQLKEHLIVQLELLQDLHKFINKINK